MLGFFFLSGGLVGTVLRSIISVNVYVCFLVVCVCVCFGCVYEQRSSPKDIGIVR